MLRYPVTATRVQLAGMSMAAHRECEVHAGEAMRGLVSTGFGVKVSEGWVDASGVWPVARV